MCFKLFGNNDNKDFKSKKKDIKKLILDFY